MGRLSLLIIVTIFFGSCSGGEIRVENVTLENIENDSGELTGLPIPSPKNPGSLKCNCEVLIGNEHTEDVMLYDNPNGSIIKRLRHNLKNEDFLIATIKQDSSDHFLVEISYAISGNAFKGWLKKSEPIGVYGRNYDTPLILHESPTETAKVNATISWDPQLYKVIGCSGNWLLVTLTWANKTQTGWLSPEMQCANPYSTCN
jgi:hypothetical protein